MKKILPILLVLCASQLFAQKKKYSITANFSEPYSGIVFVTIGNERIETDAKSGQFILKGKLDRPVLATIRSANTSCQTAFYLDTTDVVLDILVKPQSLLPVPCLMISKVSNSKAHDFYLRFQNDIQKVMRSGKKSVDEFGTALTEVFRTYMNEDPNFSYEQTLYQHSSLMTAADLESLYDKLPRYSKDAVYGQAVLKRINQKKLTAPGLTLASFEQRDAKGKKVSVKDFLGKPVLIDFWASWCKPCRMENPNIVKAYERFHEKGLEILGVSLDDDKEAWLDAIGKDGLNWKQVSDLRGWENVVAKQFYVSSIPFNILLDANGKVIATNLTGNALHATLANLFKNQ